MATSIYPDYVDAWYTKGRVYSDKGETSEARRCWGKSFSDEEEMEEELGYVVGGVDSSDED